MIALSGFKRIARDIDQAVFRVSVEGDEMTTLLKQQNIYTNSNI